MNRYSKLDLLDLAVWFTGLLCFLAGPVVPLMGIGLKNAGWSIMLGLSLMIVSLTVTRPLARYSAARLLY